MPNLSLLDPAFVGVAGTSEEGYTSGLGSAGDMDNYNSGNSSSGQPSGLGTKALEMSGTTYAANLAGGQIIPTASDWSFSIWSNLVDFHNAWMLATNPSSGSSDVIRIEFTTASGGTIKKLALQFYDSAGNFADLTQVVTSSYTTGVYHLIGVTYEKSTGTLSLFLDGALEADNGGSSTTAGLGTKTDWIFFNISGEAYEGKATEIVTRNMALPLSDWSTLYASGNGVTADTVEQGSILVYYNGQSTSAPITNVAIP